MRLPSPMDSAEEAEESGPWGYDDHVHELEARLEDANSHVAVVVSARAALRAVPALSFFLKKKKPWRFKSEDSSRRVLSAFRAIQCSWSASAFPNSTNYAAARNAAEDAEAAAKPIATEARLAIFAPSYAAYAASGNNPSY